MDIQIHAGQLQEAVAFAATALPTTALIPVLGAIRITTTDDGVIVSATDQSTAARAHLAASVTEAGDVCLPGKLLADIVKRLPAEQVILTYGDTGRAHISCGTADFDLPVIPITDYPDLPPMPETVATVNGSDLSGAVKATCRVAKPDNKPVELTTVHINFLPDRLLLVATDRYRLAAANVPCTRVGGTETVNGILVPPAVLTAFAGVAGDSKVSVGVAGGGRLIGFSDGPREITGRPIAGEYPQWASQFPDSYQHAAVVDARLLKDAVARFRAALAATDPITLTILGDTLTVSAAGSVSDATGTELIGGITSTVPFDDEPVVLRFEPGFLLDGIFAGAAGSDLVRLLIPAGQKTIITGADAGDLSPDAILAPPDRETGCRYLTVTRRDISQ